MGVSVLLMAVALTVGWQLIASEQAVLREFSTARYVVYFFGLLLFIWSWWQKRSDEVVKELPTSSYGRPLVKKS